MCVYSFKKHTLNTNLAGFTGKLVSVMDLLQVSLSLCAHTVTGPILSLRN